MKKIMFLLVMIGALIFSGCSATTQSYLVDTMTLTNQVTSLKSRYAAVKVVIEANQEKFVDEEWQELDNFDALVDTLIDKFDSTIELQFSEIDIADVDFYWKVAVEAYTGVRQIVVNHQADFDNATWITLEFFDEQAADTSTQIETLLSNPSYDNINQALSLVAGLVNLGLKVATVTAAL